MKNIIISEFIKLKRYSILWIGVVAVFFSAILAVFQSTIGDEIILYENLNNMVIWNNFSIGFPFMIVLIGGFIINREYIDHTLKNILTVPISFKKLLTGKLIVIGIITMLFGIFSFLCTLLFAFVLKTESISFQFTIKSLYQIVGMGILNYIAVLPIIIFFSRRQNGFLAGVGLAFVYGFVGIFVAGRNFTDYYPITTGLGIIGYTGSGGAGSLTFNTTIETCVLFLIVVISSIMIVNMKNYEKQTTMSKTKKDYRSYEN